VRTILFLILAVTLASCGGATASQPDAAPPAPTAPPTPDAPATVLHANLPRSAPSVAPHQTDALVRGNNNFAADLYRSAVGDTDDNLCFSPYSVSLAFSMLYAGARGNTATELEQTLRFLPQEAHHQAFNALDQRLTQRAVTPQPTEETGAAFELTVANAVWGQQGFSVQPDYLTTLAAQYGAGLRTVDFVGQPQQATDTINDWVAEQTRERITDLLPPDAISPQTRLVLTNAVYFNASWATPFSAADTVAGTFMLRDQTTVEVPLMRRNPLRVPYTETEAYQAVRLPYVEQTVDMLVLLPREGQFETVEQQLNAGFVQQAQRGMEEYDVNLTLPRFAVETDMDLKALLQGMGLKQPFNAMADFSGITEGGGLYVSDALHRSTITVDEQGAEASAATAAAMAESALEQVKMTVTRPFIFAITDRETGAILFLGRVMNPAE
jgi:serpin B